MDCKPIYINNQLSQYVIYKDGKILNTKRNKFKTTTLSRNGYVRVKLHINGKIYMKSIHRLLMECFLSCRWNGKFTS